MIKTRNIDFTDIATVIDIHFEAFSDFFLTSLGKSFLATYYSSSIKSRECVAICAITDTNEMVGFAVGTTSSKGYHKRLIINNFLPFFQQFLIIILKRPKAILRIFKNLNKIQMPDDDSQYAELLSIGVSNSFKGHGIGKLLIDNFENEAIKRGCSRVALTTDYFSNDQVVNFYKAKGYKVFYEFIAFPNRKMYKMIKDIKS